MPEAGAREGSEEAEALLPESLRQERALLPAPVRPAPARAQPLEQALSLEGTLALERILEPQGSAPARP